MILVHCPVVHKYLDSAVRGDKREMDIHPRFRAHEFLFRPGTTGTRDFHVVDE